MAKKIKRSKVEKLPTVLYVIRDAEGVLLCDDDYTGMEDGDEVAIYELIKTATVTKRFDLANIVDVPREITNVVHPRRRKR